MVVFPSIVCEKGEHLLITGTSGCGKTILLHLSAGLATPKRGSILIKGNDITQLWGAKLDRYRDREIGGVKKIPPISSQVIFCFFDKLLRIC